MCRQGQPPKQGQASSSYNGNHNSNNSFKSNNVSNNRFSANKKVYNVKDWADMEGEVGVKIFKKFIDFYNAQPESNDDEESEEKDC